MRASLWLLAVGSLIAEEKTTPVFSSSKSPIEIDSSLAVDTFRSLPEGSWNDNFGSVLSINIKAPLPYDFSGQLGGSFGSYDWAGRSSSEPKQQKELQQQWFTTLSLSYRTFQAKGWSGQIAYDWMFNQNFGEFATNPKIDQLRGLMGYKFLKRNEIGLWATYAIREQVRHFNKIPIAFKGIGQANLFWCRFFQTHGYAMLWAGIPYQKGLRYHSGKAGRFIVGAELSAPITHSLSLICHGMYMDPRGGKGATPSKNYAANTCFGISYAFGKKPFQETPYMSIANNSNFLVDTNKNI